MKILSVAALAAGWLGFVASITLSALLLVREASTGLAMLINVALLLVEFALGGFALLLFGALVPRPAPAPALAAPNERPRILLAIPVYDESARVLGETLAGVTRLDWPRGALDVVVIDDTPEGEKSRALEGVTRASGVRYMRRHGRVGLKAGALNACIADSQAPYVAVLDVDHVPEHDWLTRSVPVLLSDPRAAYVQGRIAWRNADSPLRVLQAMLQAQFFTVIQHAKAARGVAVFAGSGAVFRRDALEDVGGFPEDTLVEDFDLTVGLLLEDWRGRYVPAVVARGLLPWTTGDVARQLWRWGHGTTRVLIKQAPRLVRARKVPLRVRLECATDAAAYTLAGSFVFAFTLLALAASTGTPILRAASPLILLGPGLVLGAHVATAAVALHRSESRGYRWVLPYHLVSLAFTPVLFIATCAAYLGSGVRVEGRVEKDPSRAARPRAHVATAGVLTACTALTLGLGASAYALATSGAHEAIWAGEFAIAFLIPVVLAALEDRGRGARGARGARDV